MKKQIPRTPSIQYDRPLPRIVLLSIGFLFVAFLSTGCPWAMLPTAMADEEPFEIVLPDVTLTSGEEASAPITLKPKPGWKWNAEYPASAAVNVEGPCEATTQTLGKSGKSIEVKGKNVVFPVGLKGKSAGSAKVTVTGNFSICNEETCRIFRKRIMGFPVKIK